MDPSKPHWSSLLPAALLLAALALLGACASGHREPYDVDPPRLRQLAGLEARLREADSASDQLTLVEAGRIVYPGFDTPLWLVRYRPPGARRTALVTGGVHGNEPAGAGWVLELIEELAGRPEAWPDLAMDLIPLVNPWGWSHDQRYNRDGRDINRDFASFATQEAHVLRDLFAGQRYDLVVDHHEDPDATGVYLYQYARKDETESRRVLAAIRDRGYPLEQDVNMVILRTRDGLIDAPRWGLGYMRMTRQLSLTNYLRLENSDLVYTVETPTRLPLQDRLAVHRLAFGLLAASLPAAESR
ncbi:MAG: DUF2817 domain-containing protein [Spirochaetales bacterium]|nr:DUF2817 domain-containing protein [Spirochaetales bacterium]